MYTLLILFIISFLSIIIMIERKLIIIKNTEIDTPIDLAHKIPYIKEIKKITINNLKKYTHLSLVEVIRIYVKTSNLLKNKINLIKNKNMNVEKREISKFLKIISEYKEKIKDIKHQIKKEEESL